MRFISKITITISLVVTVVLGCTTGDIRVIRDSVVLAEIKGGAPGREVSFKNADFEFTVRDKRTPNPVKNLWETISKIFTRTADTAQVSVGD